MRSKAPKQFEALLKKPRTRSFGRYEIDKDTFNVEMLEFFDTLERVFGPMELKDVKPVHVFEYIEKHREMYSRLLKCFIEFSRIMHAHGHFDRDIREHIISLRYANMAQRPNPPKSDRSPSA